ncbi:hypothetical protein K493DRAFT_302284 [Basidiobolus meristosporus CBS 931.73]|uniref:CBM1 domain-containing protein n=1 Tax=Basidiobolus meristosporus CBS 931.73 TaxID=1314790 RepID=A0A1Y1Y7U5_9FUNG|nr:hypothetical protein K493DRAFT_302284 [Basidiobolus meristosporus CBS 931.73]|eukprot:ORX94039.1 hypothetical protein K493DRAFT_302284 [Basidiobolus meristosporus CBS 931.73]
MYFTNIILGTIIASLNSVLGAPSATCNKNSGAAYYCEGKNFYVCETSTSNWLLQNICSGNCCDSPAYAAFCPSCGSQPTTTKPATSKTTNKPTTTTTTTKPTITKTTSKPTGTSKPDPTVAPGANCLVNGRYGCAGSNFLVCQKGQWAVQNNCGGKCCSMFQYAQYCYNC